MAAVGRVARHQRSRFLAELLTRARGFARRNDPQLAGLFAGYDHLIAAHDNPEDVVETAAAGVSHLLLVTSTTEAGLRFLAPGVTERLDPAAYAKVREMLRSAVTSAGPGGDRRLESDGPSEPSPALSSDQLGRLCATLRELDCADLVTRLLAALHGNEAQVAYAARALPAVLGTGHPTDLRERAAEGISQALLGDYASDVADALRPARDSMSPAFRYSLGAALDRAVEGASGELTSAAVASGLRDELAFLDRRRRRSTPRASRA